MALLHLGLFLFFLSRLCAGLAEDGVDGPLLHFVLLNIEEAESGDEVLIPLHILLGEAA